MERNLIDTRFALERVAFLNSFHHPTSLNLCNLQHFAPYYPCMFSGSIPIY